ncbi:MAG: hypothetical protein ACKO6N_05680 [Myxococcota bacterium]
MLSYLAAFSILLKDFGAHALEMTRRLKRASLEDARKNNRPIIYLASSHTNKEQIALKALRENPVEQGLIAVISSVEPCMSFDIFKNAQAKRLELVPRWRKGLHLYHYLIHPTFGFMNARIQTWFPFNIQFCLNGREWLSRELNNAGIGYERRDNCFARVNDVEKAQALLDAQLTLNWPSALDEIARRLNPAHKEMFADFDNDYYWTVFQSEWATDFMFRDDATLERLYPALIQHGITTFQSPDILRFLGRRVRADGKAPLTFQGEATSSLKQRPEGVRIKHTVNGNSVKMYNKQGSVLRIETTINNPQDFKVYRPKHTDENVLEWQPMRKGIADLHRRAQVSQAANNRYVEAIASTSVTTPLKVLADSICQPTECGGRRVRALNPWEEKDAALLEAISRGEFAVNGLRNRDLQPLLYTDAPATAADKRKRSAAVSRKLHLLRAHGLLQKVSRTHRYVLTEKGRTTVTALITARNASTESLTKLAA